MNQESPALLHGFPSLVIESPSGCHQTQVRVPDAFRARGKGRFIDREGAHREDRRPSVPQIHLTCWTWLRDFKEFGGTQVWKFWWGKF